jgi:hypothetical protein
MDELSSVRSIARSPARAPKGRPPIWTRLALRRVRAAARAYGESRALGRALRGQQEAGRRWRSPSLARAGSPRFASRRSEVGPVHGSFIRGQRGGKAGRGWPGPCWICPARRGRLRVRDGSAASLSRGAGRSVREAGRDEARPCQAGRPRLHRAATKTFRSARPAEAHVGPGASTEGVRRPGTACEAQGLRTRKVRSCTSAHESWIIVCTMSTRWRSLFSLLLVDQAVLNMEEG